MPCEEDDLLLLIFVLLLLPERVMVNCVKYQSLIRWSEDGKAVCIMNIKQFSENVLPQYFKHNKFASFFRQLNMYNFYTTGQESESREDLYFQHKKRNLQKYHQLFEHK